MFYETIDLYDYFGLARGERTDGRLTVYARTANPENAAKLRPAILVVPGGGYNMLSFREGEPVALRFVAEGYAAFVLAYSVQTAYPAPLVEAAMAMAYIRRNAAQYGIDGDHVCAVGFSAGGHLVGMLATLFADQAVRDALGGEHVRPDAVILAYSVLTNDPQLTHEDTVRNISGGDPALREKLSIERCVAADSAPAFLWHTAEDGLVPVECTLLTAAAYRRAGVPFELHVFEKGWHGLSTGEYELFEGDEQATYVAHVRVWIPLALEWLRRRGFAVCLK